jgi:hypothetical protein
MSYLYIEISIKNVHEKFLSALIICLANITGASLELTRCDQLLSALSNFSLIFSMYSSAISRIIFAYRSPIAWNRLHERIAVSTEPYSTLQLEESG